MMRMTDETPLVNHSFALPAYVFSGRQNRTSARQPAKPRSGQRGGVYGREDTLHAGKGIEQFDCRDNAIRRRLTLAQRYDGGAAVALSTGVIAPPFAQRPLYVKTVGVGCVSRTGSGW